MKIALVVKEIEGGGIQKSYLTLFYSFLKYNYKAYLFVLVKPPTIIVTDPNIIFLDGKIEFQKGINLNKWIKKIDNFDLAIINAEYMKKYLPIPNHKIFLTVHVMWSHRLNIGVSRLFKLLKLRYRYYNENIIPVSNGIKEDLLNVIKVKAKSIKVISDPYDIEEINSLANESIDISKPFLVAVGSLLDIKRYDLMIKAFALLSNPDLKLIIVGSGRAKGDIEKIIKEYRVEEKVHLVGFDSNPYKYIKKAEILLLSSDSEGFSRVIIEASILNKPIVSTNCSPIFKEDFFPKELLEFIVPIGDIERFKEVIVKALNNYPVVKNDFYISFSDKNIIEKYIKLVTP